MFLIRNFCYLAIGLAAALSMASSSRAADDKPKEEPALVVLDPAKPSPEILNERPRGGLIFAVANLKPANGAAAVNRLMVIAIDPETGKWAEVLAAGSLRFGVSPDGRTIAYEVGNALWTRSVVGGNEVKKIVDLAGPGNGSGPIWSGDGKRIVMSLGNQDPIEGRMVYLNIQFNADGSGVTELPLSKSVLMSDWSRDGTMIVGMSWKQTKWGIVVAPVDGGELRDISDADAKQPRLPRFSPDGRRVVYVDGTDVWVADSDGKHQRKVKSGGANTIAAPCWSPDGTRLALAGRRVNPPTRLLHTVIEIITLDDLKCVARYEVSSNSVIGSVNWR